MHAVTTSIELLFQASLDIIEICSILTVVMQTMVYSLSTEPEAFTVSISATLGCSRPVLPELRERI